MKGTALILFISLTCTGWALAFWRGVARIAYFPVAAAAMASASNGQIAWIMPVANYSERAPGISTDPMPASFLEPQAFNLTGPKSVVQPSDSQADGYANAPSATLQRPTLLNRYATRPPWHVAGVDFAVGYSGGTVFKDPTVDRLPSGVSYSSTYNGSPTVIVTGVKGLTIDGWDFSLHGGVNLYVATSANVTVTNCKFGTTASSVPSAAVVQVLPDSPGFAFKYNVIDGGGALGPGTSLFSDLGGGNVTIKYNWVKNAPGGAISLGGNTVLDLRYNLFENAGRQYPEHTNYLQWSDPSITYSALVEFNTTYQQIVSPTAPGEAFQFYDNWSGGTLSSATFAYNTLVTDPTNSNATVHQTSHSYHVGDTITVAGVKAYFFCTGAGTSAASTPGAYARWSMGAPVTDGGATFYGGNQASSYLLHGTSADYSTTVTGPATIHDNYFDAKTAYGVFYPNSFNGWTLSGNYDMTTGMNLTVGGIRLKNR